jgi:hypothetical protein
VIRLKLILKLLFGYRIRHLVITPKFIDRDGMSYMSGYNQVSGNVFLDNYREKYEVFNLV